VDIQVDPTEAMAGMPVRSGWMLTRLTKMLSAVRFHQAGQSAGLRASRADTRELNVPVSLLRAADRQETDGQNAVEHHEESAPFMGKTSQTNAARSD